MSRVLAFAFAAFFSLPCVAQAALNPRVIWSFATFDKETQGWRCTDLDRSRVTGPFAEAKDEDLVIKIGQEKVSDGEALDLVTSLRRLELGLDREITVIRNGQTQSLKSKNPSPANTRMVISSRSKKILFSSIPEIHAGDDLESAGDVTWERLTSDSRSQGLPLMETPLTKDSRIVVEHNGKRQAEVAHESVVIQIATFPSGEANLGRYTLRALTGPNVPLQNGRWTLIHFWATWCPPCLRSTPALLQIADDTLLVAPVGFADSDVKLRGYAERKHLPTAFAADADLANAVSLPGVPYEVLLSPEAVPSLIVDGSIPVEDLKREIQRFIGSQKTK